MGVIKVRKQFELLGRNDEDIDRRLRTLREAVHARDGAVLDVKRARASDGTCRANVRYLVPLVSGSDLATD